MSLHEYLVFKQGGNKGPQLPPQDYRRAFKTFLCSGIIMN